MYPGSYTAEVTSLSPKATEKDVYDFFAYCGAIEHVEIYRYNSATLLLVAENKSTYQFNLHNDGLVMITFGFLSKLYGNNKKQQCHCAILNWFNYARTETSTMNFT